MLRFGATAMIAALIWLAADRYLSEWFFASGWQLGANYAYRLFGWACMSAAAMFGTAGARHWPTGLICGLVLAVALIEARMITLLTVANGVDVVVGWIETLVVFALPLWLIWLWYKGATRAT